MKEEKKKGLLARFLPREYNFYGRLAEHAEKVHEGVEALVEWFDSGDPAIAKRVREIEHEADDIMLTIASELGEVFSTPIDREDIHTLSSVIDQIMNYAKNTVREVEIFNITPDESMRKITKVILAGSCHLKEAIALLPSHSPEIIKLIQLTQKCERRVEKIYRQGVNILFEGDDLKEILKRREIYRHLSNTADRLEEAANILWMITVKYG